MAALRVVCFAAICCLSAPPFSQDFPVMDWGGIIQSEAMSGVVEDSARSGSRSGQPRAGSPTAPVRSIRATLSNTLAREISGSAADGSVAAIAYKPRPEVQQRLAQIMGDVAGRADRAKGSEMRNLVLSGKAVAEYGRIAPALGLRSNDAVDALAFYLLTQWGVANDYRGDVTRTQASAVRRQAANALSSVSDQLATDAIRQELAEMLIVQGIVMAGVHEAAVREGDNDATTRYAEIARRGGRQIFAFDPVDIALTDKGFRKR